MLRAARRLAALHQLRYPYARDFSLANGGCLIMLWTEHCLVPLRGCVVMLRKARRLAARTDCLFMPLYSHRDQL